mgnify:FL=1
MYTCILIKIKSPKLYDHIRMHNIMPLPSQRTLVSYMKTIDGNFELFGVIKEKTKMMPDYEARGWRMQKTPSKHLKKDTMELCGFVDLGSHIPDKQKNELSGHILVFRFQTFAGKSIQAFGNVTGEVQAKLMPECIILCE